MAHALLHALNQCNRKAYLFIMWPRSKTDSLAPGKLHNCALHTAQYMPSHVTWLMVFWPGAATVRWPLQPDMHCCTVIACAI